MFLLNGQTLQLDVAFTDADGIQRPANWLRLSTLEEKEKAGITEVPDPVRHDDRFFWDHDIPKDLDQLKTQWTAQVNQIAYTLLAPTDWMVTRKAETGAEIPADTIAYRAAIREAANENQTAVNSAADIDEFIAVATNLQWPEDPNRTVI